ncbi:MAG: glycosyltransferase family 4 protein [Lachnospiraceae bacterium]|nr:glycosyltransferase family 4 protein [Lachnospiraceae bacterium]
MDTAARKQNNRKQILSLSWRDIRSEKAGGAEIHTHELLKAISQNYEIVHIAMKSKGAADREDVDGISYIRHGNCLGVLLFAISYYIRHRKQIVLVFDQCNTFRFFTKFWVSKKKRVFYIHQLTREIWDIQMGGVLGKIGKMLETPMLRLNRKDYTITVSESTKQELVELGFDKNKIIIVPNGLPVQLFDRSTFLEKEKELTFIYCGRYAKYKGIDDTIEAFGEYKKENVGARLWVVGKTDIQYLEQRLVPLCRKYGLSYGKEEGYDVVFWGFVPEEQKYDLMQRAHVLVCPSVREGWGIIISEAGYLGTPSIVYHSPGLRDAVSYGETGYLCTHNTVDELVRYMREATGNIEKYKMLQMRAHQFAATLRWENNRIIINALIEKVIHAQGKRKME